MFELTDSCVRIAFGGDPKEAEACIIVGGGKCGGGYADAIIGSQGEREEWRWQGGDGVIGVCVGNGGCPAWAVSFREGGVSMRWR